MLYFVIGRMHAIAALPVTTQFIPPLSQLALYLMAKLGVTARARSTSAACC